MAEDKIAKNIEKIPVVENGEARVSPDKSFEMIDLGKEAKKNPEQAGIKTDIGALPKAGADLDPSVERMKRIEEVLEKDLGDIYNEMPEYKQREFKIKGEETAREISNLIEKGKVKLGKIISLIKKWLSIIPGAGKFFVEQEAKIKADEIVKDMD